MRHDDVDVSIVRWPMETAKLHRCRKEGVLRLVIVEGGAPAPLSSDICEDWARAPISRADLRARVATLRARSYAYTAPQVDPSGVLRFRDRTVAISRVETALLEPLAAAFRGLVSREQLLKGLRDCQTCASRNALDLHIMRIRRRIAPLGLAVRTAWGRGYILESGPDASPPHPPSDV